MFDQLRLAINHPMVQVRIRQTLWVLVILFVALIGLTYVQFKANRWPFDKPQVEVAEQIDLSSEKEVLQEQIEQGEVEVLIDTIGAKRLDWHGSVVKLAQDVEDRRKIALRILELPSTTSTEREIAQAALLRALIERETFYRYSENLTPESTAEMLGYASEFEDLNSLTRRLAAAATSLEAMGRLLDADVTSEEVANLFDVAATHLTAAAELNRDDQDIATVHFYWIDWARSKFGDAKILSLVNAVRVHYAKSDSQDVKENMRRLLRSLDTEAVAEPAGS